MISDEKMFPIVFSPDAERPGVQFCELCLGETRQWTRMLRGWGLDPDKVPGYSACAVESEQAELKQAELIWDLQEWHFDCFVSRVVPERLEESEGPELYYARGSLQGRFAEFRGRSVGSLFGKSDGEPVPEVGFLCVLLGFLEALCRQYGQRDYRQPSVIWDSLLYQQSRSNGRICYQFLFLPPEFTDFVARCRPEEIQLALRPFQIPCGGSEQETQETQGHTNGQRWAYALAVLLYIRLCGEAPFPVASLPSVSSSPDAGMAMRSGGYIRARLFRPDLSNLWDRLLCDTLCASGVSARASNGAKGSDSGFLSLQDWRGLAGSGLAGSFWVPAGECSDEDRQKAARCLSSERRRREQVWKHRRFWQRKRGMVAILSIVAIVVGLLVSTPLRRALGPPPHSGKSAYDTVRLYYQALDRLDPQLHSEVSYRGGNVIRADGQVLANLFVSIQARKGYEGRDVWLRVGDWLTESGLSAAQGRPIPALSPDFVLYGVDRLLIERVSGEQGEGQSGKEEPGPAAGIPDGSEVFFKADYGIWFPGTFAAGPNALAAGRQSGEYGAEALQPLHYRHSDRLRLVYRARKKAWYIHRIRRGRRAIAHPLPE
ncbi:hypothetical protein P0082_05655 [Candidatus Haliotispira prima]|uniref:Uncharacterized protein n=1 Tax=Candidatus Haliotispira prima TaxID=3034016 RepID=A0ABY8MKK4_9SPIO|nr:hypothetical protein P0082_05655 [Candidatus Haliotispira prima]